MNKQLSSLAIGICLGTLLQTEIRHLWDNRTITKVHRLETPMLLASNAQTKELYLLPAGTTLYFDKAFPEGFTGYRLYINIDRMPLALSTLADPTEIEPVEARPLDKAVFPSVNCPYSSP
jgi:hypothetical protein